mgnify:CR=1 FL=1
MTKIEGRSNIAAALGVSRSGAKRIAQSGEVPRRLVDRRRFASRREIQSYRQDRGATLRWESHGGADPRINNLNKEA